jgi:hypothetical protein
MRFRKLRIAWSVGCGLLTMLLVVLWVRSYTWMDRTEVIARHVLTSMRGRLFLDTPTDIESKSGATPNLATYFASPHFGKIYSLPFDAMLVTTRPGGADIAIWVPALLVTVIAAVPWIPKRFSLRTLLLATTLLAVVLGLIVYAAR